MFVALLNLDDVELNHETDERAEYEGTSGHEQTEVRTTSKV